MMVIIMKSKEIIIEAYKHLVITKKSSKITVKELCEYIPISRTTFYKYFKDTYDIIETILVSEAISTLRVLINSGLDSFTVTEAWYIEFYKNK